MIIRNSRKGYIMELYNTLKTKFLGLKSKHKKMVVFAAVVIALILIN